MMKKRLGFTLSEVLIAMAIIGVISALLVPRVMNNATKKQFTTKFKTTMNLLNTAAKEFKVEEEGYDYTGNKSHTIGAANISVILQNKLGAKLITDYSNGSPVNKETFEWQGKGLLYDNDMDPDIPDSRVSILDTSLSGNADSFNVCNTANGQKLIAEGKKYAYIPFGCSTIDTEDENPYKTLLLRNGAYVFVASAADGCNFRNTRWDGGSYVVPRHPIDPQDRSYNMKFCLAFVDVNGPSGPNRLTTCVGDTNMIFPESTATCRSVDDSSMSYASVGDIFPIWFYDDSVAPANTAANSVLLDDITSD